MPASPVRNATWRLPRQAASSHVCRRSRARSRPTRCPAPSDRTRRVSSGSAGESAAGSLPVLRRSAVSATPAMNRYPSRCTVAMYRGAPAGSPRAFRTSLTQTFSTASPTTVAGQTASRRASLVTSSPGCSTRHWSTANALGVRRIVFVPRHRHVLTASSLNEAKRSSRAGLDFVVTVSPGSYRCLTFSVLGAPGNTTRVPER